jgi:hypothetical protein
MEIARFLLIATGRCKIEMGCWWYGWIEPYALFWDEPLIVLKIFIAYWFLTLNFTSFRGIAHRLPFFLCVQLGQPSSKCAIGCWQPSGKFVTGIRGY